jgi:hypothetical protein
MSENAVKHREPARSEISPEGKWPTDIIVLAVMTGGLWLITLAWHIFDLNHLTDPPIHSETDAWLLALSGIIIIFLIFASIISWWGVILAIPTCLLLINFSLRRLRAKTRWIIAAIVTFITISLFANLLSPRGGNISPPRQTASFISTAIFDYNGKKIIQANTFQCEVVDINDGIVHIGSDPRIEGDRHWLKRSDGSIVVFPEFQTCMNDAKPGDQQEVMTREGRFTSLSDATYVFDNADNPTKVDILTADAFAGSESNSLLRSVTLARADSTLTHGLAKAFPGLDKIVPDQKRMATNGPGSDIFGGIFIGVMAQATVLAPNTKCGTDATTGVVILPEGDGCSFINECDKSAPKLVCGRRAGGLHVEYDASFSTADVRIGVPEAKYRMTLYNSAIPAFQKAPSIAWNDYRKWTPQVCIEKLCARPSEPFLPILFFYPAKHLLIEVGPVQQAFSRDMFSARGTL